MRPCDHYTDSVTCGECIEAQTPEEERPRCSRCGGPCFCAPSHRWVCLQMGCHGYGDEDGSAGWVLDTNPGSVAD